jgi:DNA-binding SARP family transcriptional activator
MATGRYLGMQLLDIHLLGDFSITLGDQLLSDLNSPRVQSLLAYLLLHRQAPQPRRLISFLFWPDSDETQARTNLRKLIYDLKHTLPDAERYLNLDGSEIQWYPQGPYTLDVAEFENILSKGHSISDLKLAIDLYRGDLLPNFYDDWILTERQRLQEMLLDSLNKLISMFEEKRDFKSAINYTHRLLHHLPLQEEVYRRLMILYNLNGDRAGVLRTFHACSTNLKRELDIDPSELTRKTFERLINSEQTTPTSLTGESKLVGRNSEWGQMVSTWHTALADHPRWLILSGDDGVGKTRLAEEILQWISRQGIATASAQCYPTGRDLSYATVRDLLHTRPLPPLNKIWLTEIARLLPEILVDHPNVKPPGPLNQTWQRHSFFEALARYLLSDQPLLVRIEDLQWCDRETLTWLSYLMNYDPKAHWLLVGTLDKQELNSESILPPMIENMQEKGYLTEIHLDPLSETETQQLVANISQGRFDPNLSTYLFQKSSGNPLYALESLRSNGSGGNFSPNEPPQHSFRTAIKSRLGKLSLAARELTSLAAAVGRPFTVTELAQASETNEKELLQALDELWQQKIFQEHETESYRFSHTKIGEIVYEGLDPSSRADIHRKIAEALESSIQGNLDMVSGEIAYHFEQAGLVDRASLYYVQAGDAAKQVYANEAAINYYQHAITLLPKDQQIPVLLKLGEVWQLMGDRNQAEAIFRQGLQLAREKGDAKAEALCVAALEKMKP